MGSYSVQITKIVSFNYEEIVEHVSFTHRLKHRL